MKLQLPINELISFDSVLFNDIHKIVDENRKLVNILNNKQSLEEIREILGQMTSKIIDESVHINLPLHTDFGSNIHIGKNVFINSGVMFTDLGGIYIEDNVLIGPRVNLITVNHPIDSKQRRGIIINPIYIEKNAWIGANSTILPGVTIGENAVVAAGSVVNKNVKANTVVGGIPAKILKEI